MDDKLVPYVPEAAFGNVPPRRNSRAVAAIHSQSTAPNKVEEVIPPALADGVAAPVITHHSAPDSGVPIAVPAIHVFNPYQQLHNGIPRIIRRRPVKWTKRCQYDLSTGCHRGIDCFFGHLGDVYTDSPTVLQEFASNGFNTKTLRRADLERVGGSIDVDQALRAVVPRSQRYPNRNTGSPDQGENAPDNSGHSSRDLFIAGAMDTNAHFTPPDQLWDEETLRAGASPAPAIEYERMQHVESPPVPQVTYAQRPNNQERSQYPPPPSHSYHESNAATLCHTGLVYGLVVGMVPFFGASTSPLETPGNLFRLNATPSLYYYGVDGVMYRYNPTFWAAQNRQYHMDQQRRNYAANLPSVDPGYQYLQSWINDLPTPTQVPEGYHHTQAQNAGAWPPAHQQHDHASPLPQQGYHSRVHSSEQQQQEQPAYAGGFHQYTFLAQEGAQQPHEQTFLKRTSEHVTVRQRRSGPK